MLTVLRYVERNANRANLVQRAQDWRWCSVALVQEGFPVLTPSPVRQGVDWLQYVNEPQTQAEVEALRRCIQRRRPYGDEAWMEETARAMGLESSLQSPGRPRKQRVVGPWLFAGQAGEE